MRTPSMTANEAEALIGPRGSTPINSANRHLVRKWLTAHGLPASYVVSLQTWKLSNAYNYENAREFGLDWHKRAAERRGLQSGDAESEAATLDAASNTNDTTETAETSTATTALQESSSLDQQTQRIASLLTELMARPGIDADAVNALIDKRFAGLPDLIAKYSPVTRIEIGRADGTSVKVEGHQHPQFKVLAKAMASRQANGKHPNIMIVGPTGGGKTHAVEMAAKAFDKQFFTNGAISMDHQLIGFRDAAGRYHETPFRKAFALPAIYLFDEIDSSDNSPLLALAGALANNGFEFPDVFAARHMDSVIIAAGNTWGLGATADFVGRNKLDGAIRSRFPVRIPWDYDESLERAISGNVDWACRVQKARANARKAGLKVIIDPRMSQAGAALIAGGFTFDEAASLTYLADLSPEQRKMVEA